jgi:hypothetical protein
MLFTANLITVYKQKHPCNSIPHTHRKLAEFISRNEETNKQLQILPVFFVNKGLRIEDYLCMMELEKNGDAGIRTDRVLRPGTWSEICGLV